MDFDFEPSDKVFYNIKLSKQEKFNKRLNQLQRNVIGRNPEEPLSNEEIQEALKELDDLE